MQWNLWIEEDRWIPCLGLNSLTFNASGLRANPSRLLSKGLPIHHRTGQVPSPVKGLATPTRTQKEVETPSNQAAHREARGASDHLSVEHVFVLLKGVKNMLNQKGSMSQHVLWYSNLHHPH